MPRIDKIANRFEHWFGQRDDIADSFIWITVGEMTEEEVDRFTLGNSPRIQLCGVCQTDRNPWEMDWIVKL